ncbi:hypothetical protein [Actinacidiphila bryophytorum]|uniref:hypothetical protein n=1 Tax=Actinacidiphila bryophytorum TaxID=1436133 RepID=UPI002176B791|nr:hypothetical protein [Actinacidiphila bryophytorum]UWE07552.1 hypothetical protein NYE86_01570 [Actinacidiphila bryophytorum]
MHGDHEVGEGAFPEGLSELLGPARPGADDEDAWAEAEEWFRTPVPGEVREFLGAYGGVWVSGFLSIISPGALIECQEFHRDSVARIRKIADPMLPEPGGMFVWGSTVEADLLFMVQRPSGWRVAAWVRQWHEWYESDLSLAEWASFAFSSRQDIPWLPEWEYPLEISEM